MTDLTAPTAPDERAAAGTSRWQVAVGGIGLVVVLWVGAQSPLYDAWFTDGDGGSGGMGHGPAGGPRPDAEAPGAEQGPAPAPGGGAHDPSQFEHGQP